MTLHQLPDEAYVGHTHVLVTGGTIMNSVYGGAANGHVQGHTYVTISGGTSGHDLGGWHGNVYAGGGGTDRYTEDNAKKFSITAGRVFGNTNLNITGGTIMHNVYGGGALASVGTYLKNNAQGDFQAYLGGGIARVNITGGTIGTNGNNNGMVDQHELYRYISNVGDRTALKLDDGHYYLQHVQVYPANLRYSLFK